jgi:hypothetical protein
MQNNRYCPSQNPHLTHEVLFHPVKVGVWFPVNTRIVGGVFLFNETINCERYVQVIFRQYFPELTEEETLYGWFQQDSATAHTTRIYMQALSDVFGDRIVSSGIWPAHSPDLNTCDFFFWWCWKVKVYNSNTEELKEDIHIYM